MKKTILIRFKQFGQWLIRFSLIMLCIGVDFTFAQTSSAYEQWKAKQEQHDLRLKQQASTQVLQQRVVQVAPVQTLVGTETPQFQQLGTTISVNINTANVQELTAKLENIGRKKAQAIIDYRQQHGAFKKKEDLLQVKGIGLKTLEKNQDRIRLQ